MRKLILTMMLAAAPTMAQGQSMPVSEFLTRAEALEKKGMMALLAKDTKRLQAEIVTSGKQLRAEQNVALAAGRKPATCLPKKAETSPKEILDHFRAIPPARRGATTVKTAFADLMRRKYPCPA